MQYNVLDYLEFSASRVPNKLAFADDVKGIDYKDLLHQARSIGYIVCRKLESSRNKPIVVFVDRNIESLVSFLGVAYSGNFYVPIDIHMPKLRIELILQTLQPIATIVLKQDLEFAYAVAPDLHSFIYEDIIEEEYDLVPLDRIRKMTIDKDPLYATFTSGSTGIPKGVITCHQSVIEMTDNLVDTFEFNENAVFGNQNPFYFDASIKDIYSALSCGATLYVIPKSYFMMMGKLIEFLKQKQVDTIMWSASAITLIANADAFSDKPSLFLKQVMFSGEVMHNKVLNYWRSSLPNTRFVNLYGPTEITSVCTYYLIEKPFADNDVLPIGIPFKNAEILLLNEKNELVAGDELGELCIRGSCLALGYYNNQEKTNEAFCQNPINPHFPDTIYRTGDLARYNELGEILFMSRKDNQVKHMGQRVELGEIEIILNSLDRIDASICFYDHEAQKIVAIYKGSEADKKYIFTELKDKVSKFMFPNVLIQLEELPFNLNGKIDRALLKDQYNNKTISI